MDYHKLGLEVALQPRIHQELRINKENIVFSLTNQLQENRMRSSNQKMKR